MLLSVNQFMLTKSILCKEYCPPGNAYLDIFSKLIQIVSTFLELETDSFLNYFLLQLLANSYPCINFVFKSMIPKKGSKPKNLIEQTIYRWFQVPAPNFSHFGPFSTFLLIFLDFPLWFYGIQSAKSLWSLYLPVKCSKAKSCLLVT